jgi:hypothetical protein
LEEEPEDDHEEFIPADRGANVDEASSTSPFHTVKTPTPTIVNVDFITENVSWCSFTTDNDDGEHDDDSENEFEAMFWGKALAARILV